jgi:hypothetical protein
MDIYKPSINHSSIKSSGYYVLLHLSYSSYLIPSTGFIDSHSVMVASTRNERSGANRASIKEILYTRPRSDQHFCGFAGGP